MRDGRAPGSRPVPGPWAAGAAGALGNAMTDANGSCRRSSIAIVGLACRYPDADDPPALLEMVTTGRRAFRRIPPCRLDLADYYSSSTQTPDATYSTRAGLIEGWQFDGHAFGVPAAAYQAADPAHWLALETAGRALAAAGFPTGAGLPGDRCGVIIGNTLSSDISRASALRLRWPYSRRVLAEAMHAAGIPAELAGAVLRTAAARYLAPFPPVGSRILAGSMPATPAAIVGSYLGFRGGGFTVDGGDASSLMAVATACLALAAGELDVAVAGGVDISLDPAQLIGMAKSGVLATGDMRIYDQNPAGFLPGEGCGVVLLMRAADARAARLPVYAEILGWGVASAGHPASWMPDQESQLIALRSAYRRSGIDPADVQLFEGCGSGTAAGDEAELVALSTLRAGARQSAAFGSIAANIGNTRAAAGVAGLIKAVLAISNGVLPPTTGCRTPHPMLREAAGALRALRTPLSWPEGNRLAGVSAAGPGGLNVHLVLGDSAGRTAAARLLPRIWPRPWPSGSRSAHGTPTEHSTPGTGAGTGTSGTSGTEHGTSTGPGTPGTEPGRSTAPGTPGTEHGTSTGPGTPGTEHGTPGARPNPPAGGQNGPVGTRRFSRRPIGVVRPTAYLMHGQDRDTLAVVLGRVARVAPWLSDGEMRDLACQLASEAADQGPVRAAIVATRQEQLARLASEAITVLPKLCDGMLAVRPGIFIADGADGRVTLLLSGRPDDQEGTGQHDGHGDAARQELGRNLAALRWLDALGVQATAAVGHGVGELAGLAWAGCVSPAGAEALTAIRAAALALQPAAGEVRLAEAIDKLGMEFRPPRRRLIWASTGTELAGSENMAELLSSGAFWAGRLSEALAAGSVGASLLLETGPGRALVTLASQLCAVPAVSLDAGPDDERHAARAAAALFAIGALGKPGSLFADCPGRPIDIWREQVFIANPCQVVPGPAAEPDGGIQPASASSAAAQPADTPPAPGQPAGTPPAPGQPAG